MHEALKAAQELAQEGINVEVINCPTIKPLDHKTIIRSLKKTGCLVTAEEHQVAGGMGSAILEMLAEQRQLPEAVEMIGMPDSFGESGEPYELLERYGMRTPSIIEAVYRVLNK